MDYSMPEPKLVTCKQLAAMYMHKERLKNTGDEPEYVYRDGVRYMKVPIDGTVIFIQDPPSKINQS
jgi:hypothetical protein